MDLIYVLVPVVVIGFFVFFILLPSYGPHYVTSFALVEKNDILEPAINKN
jgi:hypothetical protein